MRCSQWATRPSGEVLPPYRRTARRRPDPVLSCRHNERDLRRFCTRGLYLDKGDLVLDGPITEVLTRYNADYGIKPKPV